MSILGSSMDFAIMLTVGSVSETILIDVEEDTSTHDHEIALFLLAVGICQ